MLPDKGSLNKYHGKGYECNNRETVGGGVFYEVRPEAIQ
jgi:hypothetical protein